MTSFQLVPSNHIFEVPPEIAVCSYCNAKLYATSEAKTQLSDGSWWAEEVTVECESEPEMDSKEWDEWVSFHSNMPYVYQLPVNNKVKEWINTNYRFDID